MEALLWIAFFIVILIGMFMIPVPVPLEGTDMARALIGFVILMIVPAAMSIWGFYNIMKEDMVDCLEKRDDCQYERVVKYERTGNGKKEPVDTTYVLKSN